jgi:histidinol-phosphate/aromatic aminotransferase/cobyric acid decarboxylase-like protein
LIEELMNRGIIVRDMSPFGLAGAMRVSIGTPDENKRFVETIRELM